MKKDFLIKGLNQAERLNRVGLYHFDLKWYIRTDETIDGLQCFLGVVEGNFRIEYNVYVTTENIEEAYFFLVEGFVNDN